MWHTLVAEWAREGKDRVQEMTMHPPKKEEVMIALLMVMRPPTKHLLPKTTGIPGKKSREVDPVVLEAPRKQEDTGGDRGR